MPENPVRLLTYNLHIPKDDRAALARVVRELRPDVLCAQEAPRRGWTAWRMRRLARSFGLRWVAGGRNSAGTAIFVGPRVTVQQRRAQRLPVGRERIHSGIRGFVSAVLLIGDNPPLAVYSLHLGLRPEQRRAHCTRIAEEIVGSRLPTVVLGDFNESPDGPCWADLAQACAAGDHPGHAGPSFPARAPQRTIDAILVSRHLTVRKFFACTPGAEALSPEFSADLIAASDHLPVLAEVSFHPEDPAQS